VVSHGSAEAVAVPGVVASEERVVVVAAAEAQEAARDHAHHGECGCVGGSLSLCGREKPIYELGEPTCQRAARPTQRSDGASASRPDEAEEVDRGAGTHRGRKKLPRP
jgi:hypothetical protein